MYLSDAEPLIERFVDALAKQNGGALGYDGSAYFSGCGETGDEHGIRVAIPIFKVLMTDAMDLRALSEQILEPAGFTPPDTFAPDEERSLVWGEDRNGTLLSVYYVPGFLGRTLSLAMPTGFILAAAALTAFGIVDGPPQARESTAAILSLMSGAIWLLVITSRPLSTWKWVLLICVTSATIGGVFIPPVFHFFSMVTPSLNEWLVIGCVGASAAALIEVAQRIFYARQFARSLQD